MEKVDIVIDRQSRVAFFYKCMAIRSLTAITIPDDEIKLCLAKMEKCHPRVNSTGLRSFKPSTRPNSCLLQATLRFVWNDDKMDDDLVPCPFAQESHRRQDRKSWIFAHILQWHAGRLNQHDFDRYVDPYERKSMKAVYLLINLEKSGINTTNQLEYRSLTPLRRNIGLSSKQIPKFGRRQNLTSLFVRRSWIKIKMKSDLASERARTKYTLERIELPNYVL